MIWTTEEYIKEMITPRARDAHKGDCGRVLLVCGSLGMAGAAILCAKAALKSGSGLVTICAPRGIFPILQTAVPEAMCIDRNLLMEDAEFSGIDINSFDCIAIGPGLRAGHEQYQLVEHLLVSYRGPLVVDADGLNCICEYGLVPEKETYLGDEATPDTDAMDIPRRMSSLLPEITARRKYPVILTPHPGEASRLLEHLGQKKYGELGRERAAETLARDTGAIIVLKGAGTMVAAANTAAYSLGTTGTKTEPDIYLNPTGNPGMATGGSGDVLTGVITALVAGGMAAVKKARRSSGLSDDAADSVNAISGGITPMDAARCAVYMHGLAGDIAAERIGEIGMTAMDIAEALPEAFLRIAGK